MNDVHVAQDPEGFIRDNRWLSLSRVVSKWGETLERELARMRQREQKFLATRTWDFHGERWRREELDTQSRWDVIRRGLDPDRPRRFRARVLLTVRCQEKGHTLALVYATSAMPVFIPSVSCFPVGDPARWKGRYIEAAKQIRQNFPYSPDAARDIWIENQVDDDYDGSTSVDYFIRGLTVLRPHHRAEEVELESGQIVRPCFYLLCRCGQQILPVPDVMRALDARQRHLTATFDSAYGSARPRSAIVVELTAAHKRPVPPPDNVGPTT